jgi:hypothetical protein
MKKPNEDAQQKHPASDALSKPDPETLHKTDPQENMEGPISSMMQNVKEKADNNDRKDKGEDRNR